MLRLAGLSAAVLGVVIAGAVLILANFPMVSEQAKSYAWKDGSMQIISSSGRVLLERAFPDAYDPSPQSGLAYPLSKADHYVLPVDLEQDGTTEVLVNLSRPKNPGLSSELICLDWKGRTRWQFLHRKATSWNGRVFTLDHAANWAGFVRTRQGDFILAIGSDSFFPERVSILDTNGQQVDEYMHPGRIFAVAIHDLDADGNEEILLGGVNNPGPGLGHASLAVLKLPLDRYRQPIHYDGFYMSDFTGTGEFRYPLFPRVDLADVAGDLSGIAQLSVDSDLQRIKAVMYVEESLEPIPTMLTYWLDFNLKVQRADPNNAFSRAHSRLHSEGKLDHPETAEERHCWTNVLSLPTAPNGNSPRLGAMFSCE